MANEQATQAVDPIIYLYPQRTDKAKKQVPYQKPFQLISFSYSSTHEFEFSDSSLRYYVDPPLNVRLDHGFMRWIRRPEERGRLDSLLKAYSRVNKEYSMGEVGVVSWRGVMTKILSAIYDDGGAMELNIMSVGGTLYLEEHRTEEQLRNMNDLTRRQATFMYYGYAFESYCTSDTPMRVAKPPAHLGDPPEWGGDVNTNVQWCSVVKSRLGDIRVVIGGEVDCVRETYTRQPDTYVELKTSQEVLSAQDADRFQRKLLKFYFQSYLLGVPEVIVGFRSPKGILLKTQSYQTAHIPRLVRGRRDAWDPLLCLEWGYDILSFFKERIMADINDGAPPDTVWRARFVPSHAVLFQKLDRAGVDEVVAGEDRIGFLPRWYWQEVMGVHEGRGKDKGDTKAGWRI
ncbi:hypothetical protein AMATHDRAFT_64726 [Amanita thiersii Skay4041]|uniref:Decapping nuclease n=1 Tax=Amanita thiersii Skay4041 TaxID=703135 RepID=A0A2A9NCM9_9AGAR|nr:hypothetical protein AMATHDRAFT_64726 [Amanita thiersii Skay4041]